MTVSGHSHVLKVGSWHSHCSECGADWVGGTQCEKCGIEFKYAVSVYDIHLNKKWHGLTMVGWLDEPPV